MFKFIKKLLGSEEEKEEVPQESIPFSKLEEWLDTHISSKSEDVARESSEIIEKIKGITSALKENLTNLETAELQNKNIPGKALQIMQGNRESYIRLTRQFIEHLNLEGLTPETANDTVSQFQMKLEELNKSTERNVMVLMEFFANEVKTIARNVKEISETTQALNACLSKNSVAVIASIKDRVQDVRNRIGDKDEIDHRIREQHEERDNLELKKTKIERQLESIEKSKEFESIKETQKQRSQVVEEIKKKDDELQQKFASLDGALRKYSRVTVNEKLLNEYLSSPINAIEGDTYLGISELLADMKRSIESGSLELKDAKKEKALQVISQLSPDYLKTFVASHKELTDTRRRFDQQMRSSGIASEYSDLEYRREHIEAMIRRTGTVVAELEAKKGKIDVSEVIKDIETRIISMTGVAVTITSVEEDNQIDKKEEMKET